jgi:hypothetical protein
MTAIAKLHSIGDRAASFVTELSRPLSLLLPPAQRDASPSREAAPHHLDVSDETNVDLIVQHIMHPVAFLDDMADSEAVSPELISTVADQKELIRALLTQIADIKQFLEEGASLLTASHVATAENNVEDLESRFMEMERRIKETMDRCTFESLMDGSGKAAGMRPDQSFRNIVAGVCVILLIGGVFAMKKFQEVVEKREKKNM